MTASTSEAVPTKSWRKPLSMVGEAYVDDRRPREMSTASITARSRSDRRNSTQYSGSGRINTEATYSTGPGSPNNDNKGVQGVLT